MLKRIETLDDLMKWSADCNQALTTQEIVTLQDVYGHSEYKTIKELFTKKDSFDRGMVAFAINKVMGWDALKEMINHMVRVQAQSVIDEEIDYYNKEYATRDKALTGRESSLKDSLKTYWKRITSLKKTIASLKTKNEALIQENNRLHEYNVSLLTRVAENQFKADSFDTIKRLLV
jgi:hypothetical protein